ncbi:MAG: sugar transferase [Clostridiaceae bacterium]
MINNEVTSKEKQSYSYIKRIFDIICSVILLVLLSPVLLIVFIIIYFQNMGSVIYKQERVGKNSEPFFIYKFRSMKVDAPVVAAKDLDGETYVTPIGKFIRKTSIDELPQLVNIIRGEMTFVGPRPLIPNEEVILRRRRELGIDQLVPGLTGWAQIQDRHVAYEEKKIELELYYLERHNIWFDTKIVFLTFFNLEGK